MTRRRLPLLPPVAAGLLLLALAALLPGCPARNAAEALRLLEDIAAGPGAPAGAEGVVRRELRFGDAGERVADLYLPAGADGRTSRSADAALLLVPGLAPAGKDDARLVALARALARARIAVLVPDIASLRALRAGPENVDDIAAGLRFLAGPGRADWGGAPDRPVGVAAVSYAVGPAVLATLEPGLAGEVDFLVAVGGYHDLTATVTFFTTGWHRDASGAWRHRAPNAYGKWAFVQANAARLSDPGDRSSLSAMARRRLQDLSAPIEDLAAGLGPEGRSVHALVTNADPERVAALIAALPEPIRADMAALDLAGQDLSGAPPDALLIHGRDDTIIPASESVALAAALPGAPELVLLDDLAHADLAAGRDAGTGGDFFRLWRASAWVLAARDASR